jgi:hypothetical protein
MEKPALSPTTMTIFPLGVYGAREPSRGSALRFDERTEDAVVADAETEFRRFDFLEALHVAFAGSDKAGQGVEDAQGGRLVDGTKLGFGLVFPHDLPGHGY